MMKHGNVIDQELLHAHSIIDKELQSLMNKKININNHRY